MLTPTSPNLPTSPADSPPAKRGNTASAFDSGLNIPCFPRKCWCHCFTLGVPGLAPPQPPPLTVAGWAPRPATLTCPYDKRLPWPELPCTRRNEIIRGSGAPPTDGRVGEGEGSDRLFPHHTAEGVGASCPQCTRSKPPRPLHALILFMSRKMSSSTSRSVTRSGSAVSCMSRPPKEAYTCARTPAPPPAASLTLNTRPWHT